MLIIAITYQTRPQGLLYCRSHIGKREDPGDEAGHISIGHMLVRLGSTFLELHCGSDWSNSMLMRDLEMAFWVWLFITANIPWPDKTSRLSKRVAEKHSSTDSYGG